MGLITDSLANVRIEGMAVTEFMQWSLALFRLRSAMWTTGSGTFGKRISQPSLLQRTTAV